MKELILTLLGYALDIILISFLTIVLQFGLGVDYLSFVDLVISWFAILTIGKFVQGIFTE